jgi:hypothetical protein
MFESIVRSHFDRYPDMQIQDLYKLVHQAAMGSEHAAPDPASARAWLESELDEMGDGPAEPLLDPISADGEILRVHLRPYQASGGNMELLLDAFLRTARDFHGELDTIEAYWAAAESTHLFPAPAMNEFIEAMRARNFPAVHHSENYEHSYKPAYRVVLHRYFPFKRSEIGIYE